MIYLCWYFTFINMDWLLSNVYISLPLFAPHYSNSAKVVMLIRKAVVMLPSIHISRSPPTCHHQFSINSPKPFNKDFMYINLYISIANSPCCCHCFAGRIIVNGLNGLRTLSIPGGGPKPTGRLTPPLAVAETKVVLWKLVAGRSGTGVGSVGVTCSSLIALASSSVGLGGELEKQW